MYCTAKFINNYGLSKPYTFETMVDELKEGDLVIAENKEGYQIIQFEAYTDKVPSFECKLIVGKVDKNELDKLAEAYRNEKVEATK